MLDTLGGVLVIERIGNIKFLNYLENYGSVNSQPVKFGLNMIDYSKITDASSIVTALVPYGKEIDGKKLTIATVNNDCDYIYDEVAVAEYGWITDSHEWPDIDTPSALLYAAKLYLAGKIKQGISVELTAMDLSKINLDIQQFQVGDMVRCVSKPHNLDVFLSVSKKERDLQHPGNDQIILGGVTQSLTDRISGPLGGGIMGFALTTANTVKNMEYVANELSFMVKITADTVTEQGTTINETKLEMDAFQISLSALESRTTATESSIAETALTITALGSSLTSTQTTVSSLGTQVNQAGLDITALSAGLSAAQTSLDGKVSKASIIASINDSGESGVTINADKISITGGVTFEEAQTLANTAQTNATSAAAGLASTAQTNATNAAATYASNARTNAVSDVNTKLGSKQTTTFIHGGNIATGTITCDRISGGTLNFATITATNQLRITTGAVTAGVLMTASNGYFCNIYANTSRGVNIRSGAAGMNFTTDDGGTIQLASNTAVTGTLSSTRNFTAPNIPTTTTSATTKVTELAVFYNSGISKYYLNVSCNGVNRGVYFNV